MIMLESAEESEGEETEKADNREEAKEKPKEQGTW